MTVSIEKINRGRRKEEEKEEEEGRTIEISSSVITLLLKHHRINVITPDYLSKKKNAKFPLPLPAAPGINMKNQKREP